MNYLNKTPQEFRFEVLKVQNMFNVSSLSTGARMNQQFLVLEKPMLLVFHIPFPEKSETNQPMETTSADQCLVRQGPAVTDRRTEKVDQSWNGNSSELDIQRLNPMTGINNRKYTVIS